MIANSLPRRGFTVIEVLLALTIGAILMAALGAAMFAGARGMKANTDFAQATQTGRSALQTIGAAARTAYLCDVGAGASVAGTPANVMYVTPVAPTGGPGAKVAYVYDDVEKTLLLDTAPVNPPINGAALAGIRLRMSGTSPTVFPLAQNVESATFTGVYDRRNYTYAVPPVVETRLVNVKIDLKVREDTAGADNHNILFDLSESVVPRTSYKQ